MKKEKTDVGITKLDWKNYYKIKELFKYLADEKYKWGGGTRIYYGETSVRSLIRYHNHRLITVLEINSDIKECDFNYNLSVTKMEKAIPMDIFMEKVKYLKSTISLDDLDELIREKEKLVQL